MDSMNPVGVESNAIHAVEQGESRVQTVTGAGVFSAVAATAAAKPSAVPVLVLAPFAARPAAVKVTMRSRTGR